MKLYSSDGNYKLYHGNMLDMVEVIEPNSIDAIVTDPPYELNFMNCKWDNSGIAFQKETWKKCYDALKSGGHMLVFGGSRTFHRIACAIEDAGFEIRDTIMWLYGSGFPKSMNISKSLDKRNGRNPNIDFKEYLNMKRKEKNYSLVDINKMMNVATNGGGFASSIMGEKENVILPTKENYLKLKEILDLDNRYDELINTSEAERKQRGSNGGQINFNTCKNKTEKITIPSTDLAKQWDGWGTQLKPSYEPIIIARKPCEGSIVDNVMKYSVGGINIDECRVPISKDDIDMINAKSSKHPTDNYKRNENKKYGDYAYNMVKPANEQGRFPANTILTYDDSDFDEVCGGFPYTKSGDIKPYKNKYGNIKIMNSEYRTNYFNGDEGSASRYFYCAKATKRDRDEGLNEFDEKSTSELQGGRKENSKGSVMLDDEYHKGRQNPVNPYAGAGTQKRNIHPTVKPTSLMAYLVRLVTPKGGTVLDPFNGSGSTGKACMYENADRKADYKYIGIELTEEYLPISKARIEFAEKNPIMDYDIKKTKTETDKIDNEKSETIFYLI